jgi:hypothetical protein
LVGTPTERTTTAGGRFAIATIRANTTYEETFFVEVTAFEREPRETLLTLAAGDSLSATGELKVRDFVDRQGRHWPTFELLAHRVMTPTPQPPVGEPAGTDPSTFMTRQEHSRSGNS